MMFVFAIPEDKPTRSTKKPAMTENEYFNQDKDILSCFRCPKCKEYQLFRGGVYIGCYGCFNYFDEKEIIEANIGD